jgi:hypothetical protein
VLTIIVVAGAVGRATPPAAEGIPYVRHRLGTSLIWARHSQALWRIGRQ